MRRKRPLKITSRISSVTNGFVQSIIPHTEPCSITEGRVLAALGIDPDAKTCVYCGAPARHWDHLNPLVRNKRPSGFLNVAENRVPACDECNTSKSGGSWKRWMTGSAKGSPASRGVDDLDRRVANLEAFEQAFGVAAEDLEAIVGVELWDDYWRMRQEIEERMFEAQSLADRIRTRITEALDIPSKQAS